MISLLISVILFATPFVFVPVLQLGFEPPKVIFFEVLLSILSVVVILKAQTVPNWKDLKKNRLLLIVGGIFALTLLQIILGKVQLFGNVFRFQGVITLWLLLIWAVLSSVYKIKVSSVLIPALLIVQGALLFLIGPNDVQRWVGTLGEPNSLAAWVVFASVFLFFEKKPWKWIFIALCAFYLILTNSQSGMLAFAVISFVWVCQTKHYLSLKYTVLIAVAILLLSLSIPFIQNDPSYEKRSDIWIAAFQAGFLHPFIGNGFGTVTESLKKPAISSSLTIRDHLVDSSHNILLDWWVQGGAIGLGLFTSLLYLTIKSAFMQKDLKKLLFLFATLTPLLFNPGSIATLILFWWGMGYSFTDKASPSQ